MLERDYIMRLIREFAEALELLLDKKDRDIQRQEMRNMYNQYVGPYEFYHTAAISDVMDSFTQFAEDERISRMEMLADLYYARPTCSADRHATCCLKRRWLSFRLSTVTVAHTAWSVWLKSAA